MNVLLILSFSLVLFYVFNNNSSSSEYGQTWTNWRLLTSGQCWVRNTKMSKCRTVVLIKIEMGVSGSSWKGHDSLSPELVEYLRYSSWQDVIPEVLREPCMNSVVRKTVPISDCTEKEWILLIVNWWCRNMICQGVFCSSWSRVVLHV